MLEQAIQRALQAPPPQLPPLVEELSLEALFERATAHVECFITIDFETYYDTKTKYSLTGMTTESYVRDPRFEVIGVAVQIDDGEPVWMEAADFAAWAKTVDWNRVACIAHNAQFDGAICSWHFDIHPAFWFCTMAMMHAWHKGMDVGGKLASAMQHYGVGEKGDEVKHADGKRRKDFTEEAWLRYGVYCCTDTKGSKDIFGKMVNEGFPEGELWNIDQTMQWFTEPKFILDQPKMAEYLVYERARKRALLKEIALDAHPRLTDAQLEAMSDESLLASAKTTLMSNDKLAQLFFDLGVDPPQKVSKAKTKTARAKDPDAEPVMAWAFAKSDPGMQELLESDRDDVRLIAEARVAVKSTINESRTERMLSMASRGAMAVQLKYCGAHTFRWSGGGKLNFQNLERIDKKNPLKGMIRKSLLAPPGRLVVVADSAQIEARVLAWLAGEEILLADFRANRDVYSRFASEVYNRPIDRKNNPDDFIPGFVAKCSVLGLGFQLGWAKFSSMLLQGMLGGPKVQFTLSDAETLGVNLGRFVDNESKVNKVEAMPSRLDLEARLIHCAVAEAIVYRWRNKNTKITAWWRLMDSVLAAMEQGDEGVFGPGDCLQTVRHGIILPSGLCMYYPGLQKSEDGDGYSYLKPYTKERSHLYGGLITENIVQALARIIVSDQMLRIRGKYGYRSSLMTHDELVYLPREEEAGHVLSLALQEMKKVSAWAEGCPVAAEGGMGPSYGDAK